MQPIDSLLEQENGPMYRLSGCPTKSYVNTTNLSNLTVRWRKQIHRLAPSIIESSHSFYVLRTPISDCAHWFCVFNCGHHRRAVHLLLFPAYIPAWRTCCQSLRNWWHNPILGAFQHHQILRVWNSTRGGGSLLGWPRQWGRPLYRQFLCGCN